jgi:hypothetical protein
MTYYNWEKIAEGSSDEELKRIYREQLSEPEDKVKAVTEEMIKRGLLSPDLNYVPEPPIEDFIVNVSEIYNTKSNKIIAKDTIATLVVVFIVEIAMIISLLMQFHLIKSANEGLEITNEMVNHNNLRMLIVLLAYLLVYLLSGIFFLVWFFRAYDNLHKRILKCDNIVGWSIASWFVPIISLYRPFNIMRELVKKTNLILKHRGITHRNNVKSFFVVVWWTFWLLIHALNLNLWVMNFNIDMTEMGIFFTIWEIVMSAFDIILVIFTIIMIKRFSENEELLYNDEVKNTNIAPIC